MKDILFFKCLLRTKRDSLVVVLIRFIEGAEDDKLIIFLLRWIGGVLRCEWVGGN